MTQPSVYRVVVTGSESTGKTTLARELADHFGALWVREQARAYAEQVKRTLNAEDVAHIASAQIQAEDAALRDTLRRGDHWLFFDTDLISTVVYARHYYGSCPQWIEAEAHARKGDLYLLAEIDIPWTPDGIRDRPASREVLDHAFREAMTQFKVKTCHVRGLGEHRLASAIKCIASVES